MRITKFPNLTKFSTLFDANMYVILSKAKDLEVCNMFDVSAYREILHYVQNDVVE